MVFLTITTGTAEAIQVYLELNTAAKSDVLPLESIDLGSPIDHWKLMEISKSLVEQAKAKEDVEGSKRWRLDALLKGAKVSQPPPPPKPEQVRIARPPSPSFLN